MRRLSPAKTKIFPCESLIFVNKSKHFPKATIDYQPIAKRVSV